MSRAVKMLFEKGWITREQFEQAMILSTRYGETPGFHLVEAGAIADEDLVDFFIRHFSLRYWPKYKLKNIPIETISAITPALAKHLRILPVHLQNNNLTIGLTDPGLTHVTEEVAFHTRRSIIPVVVSETDMTWALSYYYGIHPARPVYHPAMSSPARRKGARSDTYRRPNLAYDKPRPTLKTDVNTAKGGWDIDKWDHHVDASSSKNQSDDAVPLSVSRSRVKQHRRKTERASTSIPFAAIASDRTTLPPEPIRVSQRPTVQHSLASMMQGDLSDDVETSPPPDTETTKESTDDLRMPREIVHEYRNAVEISTQSTTEILSAIKASSNRNTIINLALDYLLLLADRALFLTVKQDEIRGFDIKGDETNRTAIKSYWIPASADSTFGRAVADHQIHLGPLGRSNTDAVFSAALGGRPRRVLVIPVTIRNRVVGLLYADRLRIEMPPWNLLERLAEVVGGSLLGLLLKRMKR